MLYFKVDENLPDELVGILASAGHDALSVHDQNMEGEPDQLISEVCRAEQRAIVTLDIGFSNINVYPPEQFSGIIVLRLKSQDKINLINTFHKILPMLESEQLVGKIWIVDQAKVRIRG